MIRKTLFSALTVSVLLLTGCNDEPSVSSPDANLFSVNDLNFIPIDEALQNADNLFASLGDKSTRSHRGIKSIDRFKSPTRSNENSSHGLYVVNYEDNGGFALLAADRRLHPVYAISEEGSLHLSDTLENAGLSWYINDCILSSLRDSISGGPGEYFPPVESYYDETVTHAKPLLTDFMAEFHQRMPYNQYLYDYDLFVQYVVGCVPLAAGTIAGYYEWPNNIEGYSLPWADMKANRYHGQWARLFAILGGPNYTDATYGINETSANFYNLSRTFVRLNYNGTKIAAMTQSLIIPELVNRNPVIVGGTNALSNEGGHCWIIDGAFTHTYETSRDLPSDPKVYQSDTYMHCVWGWKGEGNGYYLWSGTLGGKCNQPDDVSTNWTVTQFKNIVMCYGYTPNK